MNQDELLKTGFRYHDALTGYAYALLHDWGMAEDAVQDAMIALQKKEHELAEGESVLAWLRVVVKHKSVDLIRSRKNVSYMADDELLELVERRFSENLNDSGADLLLQRKRALQKCMTHCSSESRRLLLQFYRDGESCEELAQVYHRSANSLRINLFRIRNALKACIEKTLGMEGAL